MKYALITMGFVCIVLGFAVLFYDSAQGDEALRTFTGALLGALEFVGGFTLLGLGVLSFVSAATIADSP